MRLPAKCRLYGKVPKFPMATALQHCKLSILLAEVGGFLPALFTVYGLVPFIVSFTI